jgi:prepilin-type N-terminal cleavage/methylation domain-containing protein
MWRFRKQPAFTLVELLIVLVILGVVAVFTMPMVLMNTQNDNRNADANAVARMIAQAYMTAQMRQPVTGTMAGGDLTPYMNYVRTDTSSTIDGFNCFSSDWSCLRLHDGGLLQYAKLTSFGGTASTNAMAFSYDPDGTANGQGSVVFWLYYDGHVKSWANILPNTCNSYA